MIRRTWTPSSTALNGVSMFMYDFGDYIGELHGDNWKCWRILKRVSFDDGSIEEDLELMPDDWVPKEVVGVQEYRYIPSENRLTGWQRVDTELLGSQPKQQELTKKRVEHKKTPHLHRAYHHHKVGKEMVQR